MKKLILSGLVVLLLIPLIVGCGKETTTTPPPTTEKEIVTVIDAKGRYVEVACPVERIISITSGVSEVICAFGEEDKIVGCDSGSIFPPSLKRKLQVAGSSHNPNVELILEQKPDLVIADTMLSKELRTKIEAGGVPVIIDSPSDPDRLISVIRNLGLMLDKKERAEEIVSFVEHYTDLVKERVGKLKPDEKPSVFYEWSRSYFSCASGSISHKSLIAAGGINIAAGEPIEYPTLSPEWVAERNPDIIIRMESFEGEAQAKDLRDEIMSRPGLGEVKAVKEGKVYIMKWAVASGISYPVGLLYRAKWFHPDLFQDIDPEAVHREMLQKFYGLELEGVFVYP